MAELAQSLQAALQSLQSALHTSPENCTKTIDHIFSCAQTLLQQHTEVLQALENK
jgi:hypothetical protein